MPNPHVIRLNRAWDVRSGATDAIDARQIEKLVTETESAQRIDLPCSESLEPQGLVLSRRFNRPSNLSDDQPTMLAVAPASLVDNIYVNGEQPVAMDTHEPGEHFRFGLTGKLQRFNRIDIANPPAETLAEADIRLLIYERTDTP